MEYGAIDLHTRRSQIRIVAEDGVVVLDRRIDTTRADFEQLFGHRPPMRILVESSTESEWVAQHLETFGHEVIVASPTYAAMYGSRSRKVKTDKRDVAALAEACRTGVYRRAHRVSAASRALRQQMRVRQHLVRIRTQTVNLVRALIRQEVAHTDPRSAERLLDRLERVADCRRRCRPPSPRSVRVSRGSKPSSTASNTPWRRAPPRTRSPSA